jgi:hypothetical protein
MSLHDLHKVIQTVMGWDNEHLHQFAKGKTLYYASPEDPPLKEKISELLKNEKDKISYEYDFGDGWDHTIKLEKIITVDKKLKHPVCLTGKRNCPIEDCGGPGGYETFLEKLKNQEISDDVDDDDEDEDEWGFPTDFDPEDFDLERINGYLKVDDYGCFDMF